MTDDHDSHKIVIVIVVVVPTDMWIA